MCVIVNHRRDVEIHSHACTYSRDIELTSVCLQVTGFFNSHLRWPVVLEARRIVGYSVMTVGSTNAPQRIYSSE